MNRSTLPLVRGVYGLLLIGQHLDVGEPCGVIDGHVDPVVADASRATSHLIGD